MWAFTKCHTAVNHSELPHTQFYFTTDVVANIHMFKSTMIKLNETKI